MVVGDGERPTVIAEHRVEDLSDWQKGAVEAALADGKDLSEVIRGIADEHNRSLASRGLKLMHSDRSDVGGGCQPRWTRVARSEPGQAEGRDESCCLFASEARDGGEFVRPSSQESRDAPEVPGESTRGLQAALSSFALLQDERDELLRTKRVDSAAGQTVTRGIEGYAGPQRGNRARAGSG